jgi:hypothetical protein
VHRVNARSVRNLTIGDLGMLRAWRLGDNSVLGNRIGIFGLGKRLDERARLFGCGKDSEAARDSSAVHLVVVEYLMRGMMIVDEECFPVN